VMRWFHSRVQPHCAVAPRAKSAKISTRDPLNLC
jgi:hypothetical protein